MKDFGLVSIITPSYNCGKHIAEAIESVQNQTYQNWEMLIQDDCSSDDSIATAERYAEKDNRIKPLSNDGNSGAAITRNNAIRRARGKWIAFLDSDDLWLPTKLEEQLDYMTNNHYAFTYHGYSEIDEDSHDLGRIVGGKKVVGVVGMYTCCWPGCLTVMYNAEEIGLIQIKDVKKNNDTAIWLKVIKKAKCHYFDRNLARYRRRQGSITPVSLSKKIMWHYRLFRDAEQMGKVSSFILMCLNILGNGYKKVFYIKKA